MKRVRVGKLYTYHPVGWDILDSKNAPNIVAGEIVKVVNLPGCPKANTMGHCHVQTRTETGEWKFTGLVMCASLQPFKG
jgi:hypothetical protein